MAESVLGSKAYVGAIGSSHNALAFVTRVGADYGRAHNPLADLDLVPETYTGVAMQGDCDALLREGGYSTLMRAGRFRFSVRTALKSARAYAVNFDGSRECEIPVRVSEERLVFDLDTSALEWGAPYFEVVSK